MQIFIRQKNKNGDIRPTDEDSYRAIALTSVETKLPESIILDKVKKLITNLMITSFVSNKGILLLSV